MSTTENNKLLAEFMGFVESPTTNKYWTKRSSEGFGIGELVYLKFHTDWYWIMRVVEKIEGLGFIFKLTTGSSTFLKKNEVLIWNDEFRGDSKIQATYNACVEFVKLYNNKEI